MWLVNFQTNVHKFWYLYHRKESVIDRIGGLNRNYDHWKGIFKRIFTVTCTACCYWTWNQNVIVGAHFLFIFWVRYLAKSHGVNWHFFPSSYTHRSISHIYPVDINNEFRGQKWVSICVFYTNQMSDKTDVLTVSRFHEEGFPNQLIHIIISVWLCRQFWDILYIDRLGHIHSVIVQLKIIERHRQMIWHNHDQSHNYTAYT